jgi:hypothetical protein
MKLMNDADPDRAWRPLVRIARTSRTHAWGFVLLHAPLLVLWAAVLLASYWLRARAAPGLAWVPAPGDFRAEVVLAVLMCAALVPLIYGVRGLRDVIAGRQPPDWSSTWRTWLTVPRLAWAAGAMMLVMTFADAFTRIKTLIPLLRPFGWDVPLRRVDAALHGGMLPHELTLAVFGSRATQALDIAYSTGWPLLAFVVVPLLVAFTADGRFIRQFFTCYVLTWLLLGLGLAAVMPSAGPVYYARLTGDPEPYGTLVRQLDTWAAELSLRFRPYQHYLWHAYQGNAQGIGTGILAMPSLHVAMPALWVMASWNRYRAAAWAAVTFTIVTLVGSVHLGWHYAVDGYVSLVAVPLLWSASRFLLRRWDALLARMNLKGVHLDDRRHESRRRPPVALGHGIP